MALDAGCGSGRVTDELLEAAARRARDRGRRLGGDGREGARAARRRRAAYMVADLAELEVAEPVDLIFSTATFHWIPDHDRLFAASRGAAARRPARGPVRGRGQHRRSTRAAIARWRRPSPGSPPTSSGMERDVELRRARCDRREAAAAGFDAVRCWLEPKPVDAGEPARVHPAPSRSDRSWPAARGAAATPSPRRCSGGAASRWCSTTCGSTSRPAPAAQPRVECRR